MSTSQQVSEDNIASDLAAHRGEYAIYTSVSSSAFTPQPDKFDICRIKDQNPYKAIRAACPDPADSDPAKEAERVRKILHDDLNYYSLST